MYVCEYQLSMLTAWFNIQLIKLPFWLLLLMNLILSCTILKCASSQANNPPELCESTSAS